MDIRYRVGAREDSQSSVTILPPEGPLKSVITATDGRSVQLRLYGTAHDVGAAVIAFDRDPTIRVLHIDCKGRATLEAVYAYWEQHFTFLAAFYQRVGDGGGWSLK